MEARDAYVLPEILKGLSLEFCRIFGAKTVKEDLYTQHLMERHKGLPMPLIKLNINVTILSGTYVLICA